MLKQMHNSHHKMKIYMQMNRKKNNNDDIK